VAMVTAGRYVRTASRHVAAIPARRLTADRRNGISAPAPAPAKSVPAASSLEAFGSIDRKSCSKSYETPTRLRARRVETPSRPAGKARR
jgi:hypothetical protein